METTPNLDALARLAALRREAAYLEAEIPHHVPYAGRPPSDLETFNTLPEPWRRQLQAEHPGLFDDLMTKQRIANELAEHDRQAERVAEIMADLPVRSRAEFDGLAPQRRAELAAAMTQEQREALAGIVRPDREKGAWL